MSALATIELKCPKCNNDLVLQSDIRDFSDSFFACSECDWNSSTIGYLVFVEEFEVLSLPEKVEVPSPKEIREHCVHNWEINSLEIFESIHYNDYLCNKCKWHKIEKVIK